MDPDGRTTHGKPFDLTDLCGERGPWERGLYLKAAETYAQSCINRFIPSRSIETATFLRGSGAAMDTLELQIDGAIITFPLYARSNQCVTAVLKHALGEKLVMG